MKIISYEALGPKMEYGLKAHKAMCLCRPVSKAVFILVYLLLPYKSTKLFPSTSSEYSDLNPLLFYSL